MTPRTYVETRQRFWAKKRGIGCDRWGYTRNLRDNLFAELAEKTQAEFMEADGHELRGKDPYLPKMHALHSSSALAANVFDYWRGQANLKPLAEALEIPSPQVSKLSFEEKLPISDAPDRTRFPKDPNLDVVVHYENGSRVDRVGIECKFSEAYGQHAPLRPAYLESALLWEGLRHCHALAKELQAGPIVGVNTPQLLKHLLGLRHRAGRQPRFWLVYLWYAVPAADLSRHYEQLEHFRKVLRADSIEFRHLTYQELIVRMANRLPAEHAGYVDYLVERYL